MKATFSPGKEPAGLNSEARGRNGWFRPHEMEVTTGFGRCVVSISSARFAEIPPIYLNLTSGDAGLLRDLLNKAALA